MSERIKVGVVGPGALGSAAIREIQKMAGLELVSVLAFSESKNGADAGILSGIDPIGVRVTNDFDGFLQSSARTVIYTARDYGNFSSDEQILALLKAGKNVITPLPYMFVRARGDEVADLFEAAGKEGGATLFGSGITPGFFNERLLPLLSTVTNDVTHLHMQEMFNVEDLANNIEMLKLFGFGSSREAAEANVAMAMLAENYLVQPLRYLTARLGLKIDRIERTNQLAEAPEDISTAAMTIPRGSVGSVSYAWTAFVDGKPFYTIEVFWYLGKRMRPKIATADDFWTLTIEGRPSLRVLIESKASIAQNLKMIPGDPTPPGYYMSVVAMLQAVPLVTSAAPGLLLPAMPEVHWTPAAASA
ncbi:MAG TPA: hypothetical protein VJ846_00500 [Sphingomicrobium sp.]|nr:hypothetical protein [Sphingomicrobium sp.]